MIKKFIYFWLLLIFTLSACWGQGTWTIEWDSTLIQNKKTYLHNLPQVNPKTSPNIILLVADDLGKFDLSVYGNLLVKTPNIDLLAQYGALFINGYASAPICSPSRAGMLTGRYQQRFGYQLQPQQRYPKSKFEWWWFKNMMNTSNLEPAPFNAYPTLQDVKKQGLPPSEISISEILHASGYTTAWIGKWHLGYEEPLLPVNFGFDYRYGCYEAFTLFADPKDPHIVNGRIHEFTDKHIWKMGRKGPCAIRRNETLIDEKEYLTYAFGREAIQFIQKSKDKPFFLYMPVTAPHTPYQAPKDLYDSLSFIPEHNKRVYYAMVLALDKMVGQMIACLEKENLLDNTLIMFTSDNGAALYTRTVTNAPMQGGKFTFYEGGINVPLLMYYRGKIKPGTLVQQPVMLTDLFATIADAAHVPLPADRKIDGISLLPWVYTGSTQNPHEQLFWYSDYNMAIRKGNWKLIINSLDKTVELYELTGLKSEDDNVANKKTEIVNTLSRELETFTSQMPRQLWPRLVDYEIYVNGVKTRWGI